MTTSRPSLQTLGSTVWASEQVVSYLKTKLEGGKNDVDKVQSVERHIGKFDKPEEVKRWMGNRDGGIRVAAVRIPKMENIGSELIGTINFAAYVFMTDMWGHSKDVRAEVVTAKVAQAIMSRGWHKTYNAKSTALDVRADNLYSGKIDELGVSIWVVTWTQDWRLDVEINLDELDPFLTFDFKAPIADGAPVLEAEIQLPQDPQP